MTHTLQPVILCGGSGTRLWPLSRAGFPKQFLSLTGARSLFQEAVDRLADLSPGHTLAPLIISHEDHRFLVTEQLRELGVTPASLLLEPAGRNTAPALTLAALAATAHGDDPVLLVSPADQTVDDVPAFQTALRRAAQIAAAGGLVILGIPPSRPETGYGYIQVAASTGPALPVSAFVEKPDLATAEAYLAGGQHYWNAGLFVVKASTWLQALARLQPTMHTALQAAWADRAADGVFLRPARDAFLSSPSDSVDYAVLEHCPGSETPIAMVPLEAGWNDLGAWSAVWETLPQDAQGNATHGDVLCEGSRNTLVHASHRLVGVVGVQDLVVVETADAVLVTDRARSQDVKHLVQHLSDDAREERDLHRKVHRPWGWYDSVEEGARFKVKRILVNPGASLSLQMHHHRAEHWIVVSGTAEVTCNDQKQLLTENQSTYIPQGATHRLANPGTIPLEIIEVQSGNYLGEDDIVRLQDNYGRSPAPREIT